MQEEEVVLTAAARAEETARKAEAKQKRQQELEVKEAERDAAEMADLMVSDPEVQYRFAGTVSRETRSHTTFLGGKICSGCAVTFYSCCLWHCESITHRESRKTCERSRISLIGSCLDTAVVAFVRYIDYRYLETEYIAREMISIARQTYQRIVHTLCANMDEHVRELSAL